MKRILPWVMSALLALVCINISQPSALAADNLVVNGSFEEPVVESVYGPLDWKPSLKGWELSEGPAIEVQGGVAGTPYDGKQLVELDGLAVSGIYQDVATEAGKTYKLTFAFSPRPDVAENKLNVSWGDTKVVQLNKSGEGLADTDWGVYTYYLKATDKTTRLSFDDLDETSDALGTFIDAVSLVESVAPDAPCSEGAKNNLIDFNSAETLNAAAKPITSGGVTVSFDGFSVIKVGDTKGGFGGKAGKNQVIASDKGNFNGRFLTGGGNTAVLRKNNFTRTIDFSKPVNNLCFFVADIDSGQGITLTAKDAKGASLYSKKFPASLKKDSALVTFDLSKIEGIKRLELVGNDPVGFDNLSFN